MSKLDVFSVENKKVGTVDVPEVVLSGAVDESLLHTIIKWQLAGRRQGTHMTKTKGLVSGGGKKPFKQKGTGNARQGSTRSPLMPGGGTTFGPQPRDYSFSVPKKMRKSALRMALTHLISNKKLVVVDSIESNGKTNALNKSLKNFGLNRAVICDSEPSHELVRASKNLSNFVLIPTVGLNVFDLLKYEGLICTKGSIQDLLNKVGVVG